jgi:hypothetical protein
LIFIMLFCSTMTFIYWHLGHKYFTKAIPNDTVTISFNGQKETLSLSPEDIRKYFDYVKDCYMNAGMGFMLAFYALIFVIGSVTLVRTQNRKMHRILLSRPTETEAIV